MVAHLLNLPVEMVFCDLQKGAQKDPAYVAMNPNAKVPLLEDGDFKLWESHAIMQYLADSTPAGEALYPKAPKARALVNQWLFWGANHWAPACAGLNFENMLKQMFGMGDPDPGQVKRHEDAFHAHAKVLEAELGKRKWLAGDTMTIADLAIAASLMYRRVAKMPVDGYPNVMAWFGRIEELDAWKATEMKR